MTEDPKAPGAAAVYLNVEEADDDLLHVHTYYVRIKVLTEKGKSLATVRVRYVHGAIGEDRFLSRVSDIKGRTIHPDGTIIPLSVKPEDLEELRQKNREQNIVFFTLPAVDTGSILEYRWSMTYPDKWVMSPEWEIQRQYFVHTAHFTFKPTDEYLGGRHLVYYQKLPDQKEVVRSTQGASFSLDLNNIEALPDEEFMTPLDNIKYQVRFYYASDMSLDDFWKYEGHDWAADVDRFAAPTPAIRDAVNQIVAANDSEEVRARKLYDAVEALENTNYSGPKSPAGKRDETTEPTQAEEIWARKYGNSRQIEMLYLSLLRAAGLKAYAVNVVSRKHAILNRAYLSMNQFNDYLVIVQLNGADVYTDPGSRFSPFGQLNWPSQNAGGLRETDTGTALIVTPGNTFRDATLVRNADLKVDAEGNMHGTIKIIMNGPLALSWRELTLKNDNPELQRQFRNWISNELPQGIEVEFDRFLELDNYKNNLGALLNVSGKLGTVTGKRVFLPGLFFAAKEHHPFVDTPKRIAPIDMQFAEQTLDETTYHLPDGFVIESAPQQAPMQWEKNAFMVIRSTVNGSDVKVERALARSFVLFAPSVYPALREFYQKVATADQQPLVATMAAKAH